MKPAGLRADLALVARGLFPSRAKAAEAIAAGLVAVDGKRVTKAAETIASDARIDAEAPYPWVSRGGVKLAAALDHFDIDPAGRSCLDIGASTGGFTDVLLARGAGHVTAVDVGHGQSHSRIASDPRATVLERQDARTIKADMLPDPPSLIVADVSFISLTMILPPVLSLASPEADLIALVKPQFEGAANKGGIVRDERKRDAAVATVSTCIRALGWAVADHIKSPITGGDGNIEFLLHARRVS